MIKKLNLGCGTDIRPDFLNIDMQNLPEIDVLSDARDLDFIESGTIEFIVAQHLLEYIPRQSMVPFLEEWKRLLEKNGILEIRVTDLSQLTKALYLNNISSEMGLSDEMVISLIYGQQVNGFDIRHNGFTPSFLQGVLVGLGFSIENCVVEDLDFILTARKK